MSSNLPMPCTIRNLPSYQLSPKPAPQVKIEINGDKDGENRTFTTLDLIEGNAIISVTRKTDLGHVDIAFEGKCLPLSFELIGQVSIEQIANNLKVPLQHLPVEQSHMCQVEERLHTSSFASDNQSTTSRKHIYYQGNCTCSPSLLWSQRASAHNNANIQPRTPRWNRRTLSYRPHLKAKHLGFGSLRQEVGPQRPAEFPIKSE